MTTSDRMRATVTNHGMTEAEIVAHMKQSGRCQGREAEMVRRLLDGGPCVGGVAWSLIELVVERQHGPSPISLLPRGAGATHPVTH